MGALRDKVNRLTKLLPDPQGVANGQTVVTQSYIDERGVTQYGYILATPGGGGGGTVTSFSAGTLSPLFTTSVATATSTPALTFALVNQSANIVYAGPASGGAAAPTFRALVSADLPAIAAVKGPGCVFSNGSLLLTGTLASEVVIPYGGTITEWEIVGDVAGSASIVVSHSTYAAYNTMTTLFTATCTTAIKAQATGLSSAVAAGDVLRFSGSGFAGFTRCSITLKVS